MKASFEGQSMDESWRALITIKWFRGDGSVEGKMKILLQVYGQKDSSFTNPDYCWGGYAVS